MDFACCSGGETLDWWEIGSTIESSFEQFQVWVLFSIGPFPKRPLRISLIAIEKLRLSRYMSMSLYPLNDSKHALVSFLVDNFRSGCDYVFNVYIEII